MKLFSLSTEAGITASVIHHGETLWAGAITIAALMAWAALPPLVLRVVWLVVSSVPLHERR